MEDRKTNSDLKVTDKTNPFVFFKGVCPLFSLRAKGNDVKG